MGRLKCVTPRVGPAPQACAASIPKAADPFYATAEWKALRRACFERDRYTCVIPGCGRAAKVADHKLARKQGGRDELANLRSLCTLHDNQFKENHLGHRRGQG